MRIIVKSGTVEISIDESDSCITSLNFESQMKRLHTTISTAATECIRVINAKIPENPKP